MIPRLFPVFPETSCDFFILFLFLREIHIQELFAEYDFSSLRQPNCLVEE